LDIVFFENADGFFEKVSGDPGRSRPVFLWNGIVEALCLRFGFCQCLEFFGEGNVVEEGPGVVELVIPCPFQIAHGREEVHEFFIAHEGEEGSVYARRVGIVGAVVVGAPEWLGGFADGCEGVSWRVLGQG